jgi:hypothetical protein
VFVDDLDEVVYAILLLPLLLPPPLLLLLLLSSLLASSYSLLRQDGLAKTAFTLTILPWSCLSPFALSLPFPPSLTEYWTRCPNIACRILTRLLSAARVHAHRVTVTHCEGK